MTLKKAYRILFITIIFMMLAVIFYALDVSKMQLTWGIMGFSVAVILSIFAVILSINVVKHEKDIKHTGFLFTHRFEILDWFSFLSISMMAIFLLFTFVLLPSDVDQFSMYPTLEPDDRVLIYHFQYEPTRDDVVIIRITKDKYPLVLNSMFYEYDNQNQLIGINKEIYFVKRIVGIPGDLVEFELQGSNYAIKINGSIAKTKFDEDYLVTIVEKNIMEQNLVAGILKEGLFFAFGDNPNGFSYIDPNSLETVFVNGSFDSRNYGAVLEEDIIGQVIYRLWPLGRVS
jgi:signal peptidase I